MKVTLLNEDDLSNIGKTLSKDKNPMVKKLSQYINKTSLRSLKEDGDKEVSDILQDFTPSVNETFNIDIMDKMVFGEPHLNNPDPILKSKYNTATVKADELFGYHKNEEILNYLYLEYVIKVPELMKKYVSLMVKYHGGKKTKFDQPRKVEETTGSASSGAYAGAAFAAGSKWIPSEKPIFHGGTIVKPNTDTHDMGVNSFKVIRGKINENINYMEDYILNPDFAENMLKSLNEDAKPAAIIMIDGLGKENEKNFKKDMSDYDAQIKKATEVAVETGEKTTVEPLYDEDVEKVDEKKFDSSGTQKEIMLNRGMGLEDVKFDIDPGQQYLDRMKQQMGDVKFKEREEKAEFHSKAPMYNKDVQPVRIVKESNNVTGSYIDGKGRRQVVEFVNSTVSLVESVDESCFKLTIGGFGVNTNSTLNEESENFEYYINKANQVFKTNKNTINESDNFNKMKHLFNYNSSKFQKGKK
jgi:hypothetical protein